MSKPVAVEQVEVGDRAVLWFQGAAAPVVVNVGQITEGAMIRTLHCSYDGQPFELSVQRGHTVDLAC